MFNVGLFDELRGLEKQLLRSACRCAVRFWREAVTHAQIELVGLQVSNGQCVLIGPLQWAILRKYRLAFLQMRCKSLASVCSGEAENLKRR